MTWNADYTLQLIAILVAAAGASLAWYKRRRIAGASSWLLSKLRNLRIRAPKLAANEQQIFGSLELGTWDDPGIEAGAAISAWAEEVEHEP